MSSRRSATGTSVGKETASNQHAYKDYMKRRNLVLALIKREIDRLATWHNPLARPEQSFPGEESLVNWSSQTVFTERNWRDLVRLAWRISPDIAVYLPARWLAFTVRRYTILLPFLVLCYTRPLATDRQLVDRQTSEIKPVILPGPGPGPSPGVRPGLGLPVVVVVVVVMPVPVPLPCLALPCLALPPLASTCLHLPCLHFISRDKLSSGPI